MRELLINISAYRKLPKYQALATGIREAIREGKVRPGEKIPSTRELAARFQMDRHTVLHSLRELEAEGWLESEQRKFFRVTALLPERYLGTKNGSKEKLLNIPTVRSIKAPDFEPRAQFRYSFPSGMPDLRLFPMREFKSHLYDSLKTKNSLDYGDPCGHPKLVAQVRDYLRRVRQLDNREVVITNGSQEAIFLLAQLFLDSTCAVAVEALGYPPAVEALRFSGAKIVPIEVDGEGLVVEDLRQKLKRYPIKMLYTTPLHQYPTTVSLSATRRLQLYELAVKERILILEDDYDHEFHYKSQPIAPLASFDPAGIVLYVSTFSKILFPAARVGYVAVSPHLQKPLKRLKKISSRQNEQLMQLAIAYWMKEGGFERHLRKMRRTYDARREHFGSSLESLRKQHPKLEWRLPDGGMAIWLNTNQDSEKLARSAVKENLQLIPERHYQYLAKNPGSHLRLGFSGYSEAENHAALKLLGSLL